MKRVEFTIDNSTIQFSNNWMGNETILVNGTPVSKKFSIFGTTHYFNIVNNGVMENYSITTKLSFKNNLVISLFKNDELMEEKYINCLEVDSTNFNSWFIFGILFIVFSLMMDDSKYLGFLGLIFMILSINKSHNNTKSDISKND